MPKNKKRKPAVTAPPDPMTQQFWEGWWTVLGHPIFRPMAHHVQPIRQKGNHCPRDGWVVVTNNGDLHIHPTRLADPDEWVYVIAHCLLHLGLEHFRETEHPKHWNIACDWAVTAFLQEFKLGRAPQGMDYRLDGHTRSEQKFYEQLLQSQLSEHLWMYSAAGYDTCDMLLEAPRRYTHSKGPDWKTLFAQGLHAAVKGAVAVAGGMQASLDSYAYWEDNSQANKARLWFMNHFPLLGGLAANFKVISDPALCARMDISVAAVNAEAGEIYMNSAAGLNKEQYLFVMAHELLHVALRHHARRQGRDAYYWNVACDYVINDWLLEMGIGEMPSFGLLYDPALRGLNAEAIYDVIVNDLRKYRRLATFRGYGQGDMLGGANAEWWKMAEGMRLDDFYRRALSEGLQYHQSQERGLLPASLIEEILAQSQPPIPWDVELARWFDLHFPPLEKQRSYARPSRRQASTPDIPRPRYALYPQDRDQRTFGVVLDTSGSMDRHLLAKALGAIASYSIAKEVTRVRVVFCDAAPYDQGYLTPEAIGGRVKVKGRGGTVLMPGIQLLEQAEDFPREAPILIITDTYCDTVSLKGGRDHAFLIPQGQRLPFPYRGQVFYIS